MGRKLNATPQPFAYPLEPHLRRHGPLGYKDYGKFRPWLRDEFSFRCVFCLRRETWGVKHANWDIDHFTPQMAAPLRALDYENLLYVCSTCNSRKSIHLVPNPCKVGFGNCLEVRSDGTIQALNVEGELLIEFLRLDDDDHIRFRRLIIDTVQSLRKTGQTETLLLWLGYPQDLPDLSKLKPTGNTKPEGVAQSHYARRMRGELPEMY
ncbi:MAG: hypothetical protein JNM09_13495 [Blastocatellia bacterium]|nr:hypothetical protein [Blastocatellia bacterium]